LQPQSVRRDKPWPWMPLRPIPTWHWQQLEGESHDRAALVLAPNDGYVLIIRAVHLMAVGRLREGLDAAHSAYALAPADPLVVAYYAWINAGVGRDAEASRYAAAAIDLGFPKDGNPLITVRELTALHAGRYAEAAALRTRDSNDSRSAESARFAYGALEHPAQRSAALTAIARLFSAAPAQSGADPGYASACINGVQSMALVGGLDEAFALANRCLTRVEAGTVIDWWRFDPWSPEMRGSRRDTRFQAYVTRLGMMEYYQQYGPSDDCELKNNKLTCH
jgi:hypothetical protein